MEEFDNEIMHRPASQMRHVDALSRNVSQNNDEHIRV